MAPTSVVANRRRARFMTKSPEMTGTGRSGEDYISSASHHTLLHFPVPVFRLGVHRPEDFHVPFAAAPRFDDLRGYDVDENFREEPPFWISLEVVGRLVPSEI